MWKIGDYIMLFDAFVFVKVSGHHGEDGRLVQRPVGEGPR